MTTESTEWMKVVDDTRVNDLYLTGGKRGLTARDDAYNQGVRDAARRLLPLISDAPLDVDVLTEAVSRTKICLLQISRGSERCPDPQYYHRHDAEDITREYDAIRAERRKKVSS